MVFPGRGVRLGLRLLLVLLAAAAWCSAVAAVAAQDRLVSRTGKGEAAIYQDDLEQARSQAVDQARRAAVSGLVSQLLAPEWIQLFEGELGERILDRPDTFVSAFRVSRLDTSPDRTQYFATVEAQVDRPRVIAELRALALPIRGAPTVAIQLLYRVGDPVLRNPLLKRDTVAALTKRLALLNLRLAGVIAVPDRNAAFFSGTSTQHRERADLFATSQIEAPAVAYLQFNNRSTRAAGATGVSAQLGIYLTSDGLQIGAFAYTAEDLSQTTADTLSQRLLEPLLARLQPGILPDAREWGTRVSQLSLRVVGFGSVYDEERFEREFFTKDGPFSGFVLSRMTSDAVTYTGEYRGDRGRLSEELTDQTVGGLKISDVAWRDEHLELSVTPLPGLPLTGLRPFPESERPDTVQALFVEIESLLPPFALQQPIFAELEDNGQFDRANVLDFGVAVYGFVDSRADNDLYLGEALTPGEMLEVDWYRLGRSNLSPVLRFYDDQGILRHTAHLRLSGQVRYKVPPDQQRVYLEVGDRHGSIDWDTGGYLSYHYVMWVRRLDAPQTVRANE